ncbi:MAG: bifunctional copper resistance protein CopD/cytochrome c oxidase assembly protein [Actinomycetes bacterium]
MARPARAALGGVLVAATVMAAALVLGGGRPQRAPAGIPDAGLVTEWALAGARLTADLAAVATVGLLLAAAVLVPSTKEVLSRGARRAAVSASWAGLVWTAAAAALAVLTLADVLALPLADVLRPSLLRTYLPDLPAASGWAVTAGLAAVAALTARTSRRPSGAWAALVVALVAVAPPALAGHAAAAGDHDLAISSLVVHVVAVVVWVGGLVALVWYAGTDGRFLSTAAHRYSPMALTAFVAVGVSGVANAVVRLPHWSNLWDSGYGRLVSVKLALFVVLGVFGWWHRRRTLPALERGEPNAFRRFAGVEALVMVAVIGVAAALSRTPTPVDPQAVPLSRAAEVLGYAVPPAPTLERLVTAWRIDTLVALTLLAMVVFYAAAVIRLRRRGDPWPVGRSISWALGVVVMAVATLSGLSTYGRLVFSIHMTQHMLLGMVAPILLVLGAPIGLAIRALPAAGRDQPAGAREWLLAVLHSRVVRVLTNPVVALVLFITAPYMVYFGPLFGYAMQHHWAHLAMHAHFVLVGYLFYESIIGVDPLPNRAPFPLRLIVLFVSLPFHAFFAIALMSSSTVVAHAYYASLGNPYAINQLVDQTTGSSFAWGFGEVPMAIALIALLIQWARDDARTARRGDRQADRDGDAEREAYNQMLAARSRRDH